MDIQKVESTQEHLKPKETNAQLTPPIGKIDTNAVMEGLAMVMDGLRVMERAGAKLSRTIILFDGKIMSLPAIEVAGHGLGIKVMDNGEKVFTVDGISVMEGKSE